MGSKRTILYILGAMLVITNSHPMKTDDSLLDKFITERKNLKAIEQILTRLEVEVAKNAQKLYNRVTSLTLASDKLLQTTNSDNPSVSSGEVGDMSQRCPKGFQAIAGDSMCYYLSTYKLPFNLAREQCRQLGGSVDLLSIPTTKRHFTVTHLIQSDPEAKSVKKWWTAGVGNGFQWLWEMRLDIEPFFWNFWADRQPSADRDTCMVLDSDHFYQWKKIKCGSKLTTTDSDKIEQHHFICEQPALELASEPSPTSTAAELRPNTNNEKITIDYTSL